MAGHRSVTGTWSPAQTRESVALYSLLTGQAARETAAGTLRRACDCANQSGSSPLFGIHKRQVLDQVLLACVPHAEMWPLSLSLTLFHRRSARGTEGLSHCPGHAARRWPAGVRSAAGLAGGGCPGEGRSANGELSKGQLLSTHGRGGHSSS